MSQRHPGTISNPAAHDDRFFIRGIPIDRIPMNSLLRKINQWISEIPASFHHIVTVNPEFVVAAQSDAEFRKVLQDAEIATPDGIGISIASRIFQQPIHERITGVDLTEGLAGLLDNRTPIFMLGAATGVADKAATNLTRRFPNLHVAGTHSGSPRDDEASDILDRIQSSNARVLLVAFGAPQQDLWIAKHHEKLAECGIVIAIGVGGTFDYLAGIVSRPPALVRRLGVEWLYRLIRQPWRWRRQLRLPVFVYYVFRDYLTHRRILE